MVLIEISGILACSTFSFSFFFKKIVSFLNNVCCFFIDGELNVLDDILTDAPDHDDELYNPDSEQDKNDKKGMLLYNLVLSPEI